MAGQGLFFFGGLLLCWRWLCWSFGVSLRIAEDTTVSG